MGTAGWGPGLRSALRASWAWSRGLLGKLLPPSDLGRRGEAAAARYLRHRGLCVITRNWRARRGEIDLVAVAGDTLVFVEVKSSQGCERGDALGRIDFRKVERIRRAARSFQRRTGGEYPRCRLDGVVVEFSTGPGGRAVPTRIRWYPGLFSLDPLD